MKELSPGIINVSTNISRSPEDCFDYIVPVPLPRIFKRFLVIPAVVKTDEKEMWMKAGLTRTVYFSDGSTASERLETVNRPKSFTYTIWNFRGINRYFVDHIYGEWQFMSAEDNSTNIQWTYSLYPKNKAASVVVRVGFVPLLTKVLNRALAIARRDLEKKDIREV